MLLTFAFIFNTLLAFLVILLHYEVLFQLDKQLPKVAHLPGRFKVLVGAGVIFMAHIVEIWIFALGYLLALQFDGMGGLTEAASGHGLLLDYVYLSFVTYTTVGYGDIAPGTPLGQLIASAIMILGYAIIAIPTGIVGAEIMKSTIHTNTQGCPNCLRDSHQDGAEFCYHCGDKLNE